MTFPNDQSNIKQDVKKKAPKKQTNKHAQNSEGTGNFQKYENEYTMEQPNFLYFTSTSYVNYIPLSNSKFSLKEVMAVINSLTAFLI